MLETRLYLSFYDFFESLAEEKCEVFAVGTDEDIKLKVVDASYTFGASLNRE